MTDIDSRILKLKEAAVDLIDDGSNSEYVRGICELIAEMDPITEVDLEDRSNQIKEELLTFCRIRDLSSRNKLFTELG
jgi:hypothetical protein